MSKGYNTSTKLETFIVFIVVFDISTPYPKWQPVKVGQSSNFDRLPFYTELAYTSVGSTVLFLLSCRLKEVPHKRVYNKNPKIPFWEQLKDVVPGYKTRTQNGCQHILGH